MTIAPKSSATASVSKKTFSGTGTRGPNNARTPIAKAISVAAGIAQPAEAPSVPLVTIKYTIAGAAMPPTAAPRGRKAWRMSDKCPTINSRLISKPIKKKKMAINPSLTHSKKGLSITIGPTPKTTFVRKTSS